MTGPSVLHETRAAYDAVATLYAELFSNVLETLPMERALLAAFAELVRPTTPDLSPTSDAAPAT